MARLRQLFQKLVEAVEKLQESNRRLRASNASKHQALLDIAGLLEAHNKAFEDYRDELKAVRQEVKEAKSIQEKQQKSLEILDRPQELLESGKGVREQGQELSGEVVEILGELIASHKSIQALLEAHNKELKRNGSGVIVAWIGIAVTILSVAVASYFSWSANTTSKLQIDLQKAQTRQARRQNALSLLYDREPNCNNATKENNYCLKASDRAREEALVTYIRIQNEEKKESILNKADLRGINLSRRNLSIYKDYTRKKSFVGADFRGAKLWGTRLNGADLRRAKLDEADCLRADFQDAHLKGAHLNKTNLREANLVNAKLPKAHLVGADLSHASLKGANLKQADLRRADLKEANLRGVSLVKADLGGSDIRCVDLRDVDLKGSKFEGVCADERTQWPKGFKSYSINEDSCIPPANIKCSISY